MSKQSQGPRAFTVRLTDQEQYETVTYVLDESHEENTMKISTKAVEAITDPDVALQFARDAAKFAEFAQAHAEHCHHVTYQLAGIDAARRRRDEARLAAPEFLNLAP
jgi:hypothetical protein